MSMRILIPMIGLDNRGGTRIIIELANRLSRRGHYVKMLVPRGTNKTTFAIDKKVEIKPIGFPIRQIEDFSSIIRTFMLLPLVEDCDIVLATYYLTSFPIFLSTLIRKERKYVYLIQHFEPLAFGEAERTFPSIKKCIAENTYRFDMHQIAVAAWIAERVSKISHRQVNVIHPSIDDSIFIKPETSNNRQEKSILIFPGRDIWKGWIDFTDAYSKLITNISGMEVLAVSREAFPMPPGPYNNINPENDLELVSLYQRAAVYVHPAWWEGCPLSPLEAMACGTPVVAAASEGIKEYAVDGGNCLLVPPRSPEDLANAIRRVLEDKGLRKHIVEGGFQTVKDYAWPKMADEFEALLLNLCDNSTTI